jgi:hypothetical protein
MRAKVILSASALALLILAPTIYFHFTPSSPPPDQPAPAPEQVAIATPQTSAAPAVPRHRWTAGPANGGEGVPAPGVAADLSAANHEDYVAARQAELAQLGMSDDPADLKTILSELNNKDARIRSAALSATIQFRSQDAIPALQNEIAWTDDPQEKVDLLNAIKYLQLPTFQEYQANLAGAAPRPSSDQTPPTN